MQPSSRPTDKRWEPPKAKILIVDDKRANLLALRAILDDLGLDIVEATTGDDALLHIHQTEFAVILLDVQMPGISGFEMAKLIRERDRTKHTPIIFITANDVSRAVFEEGYTLGAVDFLVKPILPFILRAKLSGLVELYQEKQWARYESEQFRLLVDGTTDYAIFMLDPDGYVMTWNTGARRIKQYTTEEIVGQHFSRFYPQEAIDRAWPQHELQMARKTGRFEDEGWRVRKDGTQFWANVVITALNEGGKLRGFSKVTRDLTERKANEENARRLAEEEAARRTAEKHAQLLRDADRRKDEFLATLAHELRNPLAPIRNALQILKMPRVDTPTTVRTTEIMERQVKHLVRLVDDLLDVSRVMRGKIELRRRHVELASVIAQAVETAQPLIEAQGHELMVQIPSDSLPLDADPDRLAQVFANLLTNAAKYTEAGGSIQLSASRDDGHVIVRVRDTGIGIDPTMLGHVFDLFVQADHAADRAQGGLGIGLTLVRSLVDMHGGSVEATSAGLGSGSEFIVRLPLLIANEKAAGEQESAPAPAPVSAGHRLLVVDDNRDAANSLALLLRLKGYDVEVAHDGFTALAAAKNYHPEIIFLDIGMPGMDGYEVARRIRAQPDLADTVLAAVTGWGQREDRRRSNEAGFNYHLVKPPEPKILDDVLDVLKKK